MNIVDVKLTIKNLDDLSLENVENKISAGGRFVIFQYSITLIFGSFRNLSSVYYYDENKSSKGRMWFFNIISIIFSIISPLSWDTMIETIMKNRDGGTEINDEVIEFIKNGALQEEENLEDVGVLYYYNKIDKGIQKELKQVFKEKMPQYDFIEKLFILECWDGFNEDSRCVQIAVKAPDFEIDKSSEFLFPILSEFYNPEKYSFSVTDFMEDTVMDHYLAFTNPIYVRKN